MPDKARASLDLRQCRMALEQTLDPVCICDMRGRVKFANRVWWRLHGRTEDEAATAPGRDLGAFHSAEQLRRELTPFLEQLRKVSVNQGMLHRVRSDGTSFPSWTTAALIHDDDGEALGFVVSARDISDARRVEQFLDSQFRVLELLGTGKPLADVLEALVQTIEVICVDTRASVLLVAEDGKHLRHGAAPSLPDPYNRAVDGVPIGPAEGSCGTAAYFGRLVVVEDIFTDPLWSKYVELARRHDLRACWSHPIIDVDGKVLGTFAMYYRRPGAPSVSDLTMIEGAAHLAAIAIRLHRLQRGVERQLEKAEAELVRRTRLAAIGQVAASIAHELRNPLGAIRNATYFLRQGGARAEVKRPEYLGIIDEEIRNADRIVGDLLDMTRARPPARETLDLAVAVGQAFERVRRPADVTLELSFEPEPFRVHADPGQLRQVFVNLFTNSVQSMERGGRIRVTGRVAEGDSLITVEDDGSGVARELRATLFDPLVTDKAKGSGLGLTICRDLLERHGGGIELLDRPGRGATFRIRLPGPPAAATD